jgi:hypothetical protein
MKKTTHFGTILLLLFGLFSNTAMGQTNYVWNGTSGDWATATNWTPNGVPGTNAGDTATISNGGTASIGDGITPISYILARVTITNATGPLSGSTLTINPNATLTLSSSTAAVITLNGGNIINNGTLNITSTSSAASIGITCATPAVASSLTYGYSGSGALNITISASTTANRSAIACTSLGANSYQMLFNGTTTLTLGSSATTAYAIRAVGGTAASPLIIGGAGFTIGGAQGGLLNIGGQSTVTVNSGTTLTMNSANTNITNGILVASNTIGSPTNFTNKGTINIIGESLRSGIAAGVTVNANNQDVRVNIVNDGIINVDLACITPSVTNPTGFVWTGESAYKQQQAANSGATGVIFTNNGTLTLKNSSTIGLTGYAIWGSGAGQRMNTNFTNNGSFNLDGSINSIAQGFTLTNNGIVNSNNSIAGFPAFNNNATGSINFLKTPAIFTVLAPSAATAGATYTDGNLNLYTVRTTKLNGTGTQILASTAPIAAIPATGTLTLASGTGDATIDYSAVTGIATTALSSTTINSGTISTGEGVGNLNIISSATFTLNSTSVLDPGGSSGKGITNISKASLAVPVNGVLRLQVAGSAVAGVDYDQITNSGTNGGFDISAATLEITSLYSPSSSAIIPIVVASGTGTISGPFASVTGLTPGWTVSYASPTAVNLVYTVITIPTIWTGAAADNNFFNEANWKDSVTNIVPAANTINPGANINLPLQINSAAATITSGAIQFGSGSLTISSANLTATSFSGGTVTVNEGAYVTLSSATPLLNNVQINFTSGIGWIKTPNYNARAVSDNNIGQIKVNNINAIYANNLRLDHYYLNGCVIRANLAATAPLTVYDSTNLGGSSAAITVNTIHTNTAIANSMNNKIESFLLKKGFMVTLAIENDGTGKSKNYIASEEDLVINTLPISLINSISFIRVMPWNWVTKKGRTDRIEDVAEPLKWKNLNTSWIYRWNNNYDTKLDYEYAPMSWGNTGADDANDIALYVGKYNSTHLMSFNEPDDCDGQSGQFGNLCQTDVAISLHKNLMKTGMRLVSPGGREEAPFGWLKEFYDKAKVQDIRIDVIAVHWYDWGSNPAANPNPTALQVFNRFKAYLTNVHNLYGLPIWITEFNANPARSNQLNADFLALALPYLETLDYVERYNWFPYNIGTDFNVLVEIPNPDPDPVKVAEKPFILSNTGTISAVGTAYTNQVSTTAIPDENVFLYNNLQNVALKKTATASSTYATFVASNAVDGDVSSTSSRWVKNFGASGDVNYSILPAWLEVDLEGSFTINSFRIIEDIKTSKDFQFEVWDASTNSWISVLNVTGNDATPLATYKTFNPVTTSKVRLYITGHNDLNYLRIFELEVYGEPNNPSWTGLTSTAWTTATNWSTGIVPDQYSNVTIPNVVTNQPLISATTTINSLNIAAGATLTVTAPNFTVTAAIANSGTMTLANNSNLIQEGSVNANTGNIVVNRNSNALSRLDYTIWSSPVENQNLVAFSPETSLNRFYNYNQTSNLYNAIASPSTTVFGLAAGYLIRMPNTAVTAPATQTFAGVFNGIPNNGNITKAVNYSGTAPFGYNMIGNPYPSTINANEFIAANTSRIGSTLYFWRKKNGAVGTAYATWNRTGSVGTASGAGSEVPNGTIQVGQGFFVKASSSSNVTFTNAMRNGTTTAPFFKTRQEDKHRIWLNLTNTAGVFSQTLVGYLTEGTNGLDDFDGKYINDSPIALTSNINNEEYTIQSRPSFDPSDIVALNFKTDVAGEYTIALDHLDGVFANGQDVYLADSKTGAEVDLKVASHTFTAAAGVDDSRFSLKYQKTLKVDASAFNENSVRVYKNNGTLYVNSGSVVINNIKVFDIQGRLITEQKNVKANTAAIKNLKIENQVLIVKITGEDNSVVTKKVVH